MDVEKLVSASLGQAASSGLRVLGEYQTDDYLIAVGFPTQEIEAKGRTLYCIVNKVTGVIETFDAILPQAVGMMQNLQSALDKLRAELVNAKFSGKRPIITN